MNQSLRELVASNVKKYRIKLGYKREALSLLLGWDNSYISKLERGKVNITIDKLEALTNVLKINITDLFENI